jgi:hypothetical protein
MEPARKRGSAPTHLLRLEGPGKPSVGPHRVWPAIVSTVRIVAADVSRSAIQRPESQWHLSGWCAKDVPIVVVLATGNSALVGQVDHEIFTFVAAPVRVNLPGGGHRLASPYVRTTGSVAEVFIDALFDVSRLQACSMAEASRRIARLDAERTTVSLHATRYARFDRLCRSGETRLWNTLIVDTDVAPRLCQDLIAAAPENDVISVLCMIDQRCREARVELTPAVLCRIAASLAMHCCRYKFGWFTVARLIEKLLDILGIASFRLQTLLTKTAPKPVAAFPSLAKRFAAPPPRRSSTLCYVDEIFEATLSQWPRKPGSMVALVLTLEQACELGFPFKVGEVPEQTVVHGGLVYLGPDAANSDTMKGFANARLAGAMTAEMRELGEKLASEDEDWHHHEHCFSELAVPLAFGSAVERVMPVSQLDELLRNISDKSLLFEERKQVAKTLALGCNAEQRVRYYDQFVTKMKPYKEGKNRTDELLRWMKWYMTSRGIV